MLGNKQYDENGKRHGLWVEYYVGGGLSERITYINGVVHGKYESYFNNGEASYLGFYVNGIQFGYHIDNWLAHKNEWYYAR